MAGPARYSANRSSKEFIGGVRTRTIAPFARAPSFSKSSGRPAPPSTSGAVSPGLVEGARANDTTLTGNREGSTTSADAEIASHFADAV